MKIKSFAFIALLSILVASCGPLDVCRSRKMVESNYHNRWKCNFLLFNGKIHGHFKVKTEEPVLILNQNIVKGDISYTVIDKKGNVIMPLEAHHESDTIKGLPLEKGQHVYVRAEGKDVMGTFTFVLK